MACYLHGGGCGAGRRGGGVSHRNIGDGEELLFAETQEEPSSEHASVTIKFLFKTNEAVIGPAATPPNR